MATNGRYFLPSHKTTPSNVLSSKRPKATLVTSSSSRPSGTVIISTKDLLTRPYLPKSTLSINNQPDSTGHRPLFWLASNKADADAIHPPLDETMTATTTRWGSVNRSRLDTTAIITTITTSSSSSSSIIIIVDTVATTTAIVPVQLLSVIRSRRNRYRHPNRTVNRHLSCPHLRSWNPFPLLQQQLLM